MPIGAFCFSIEIVMKLSQTRRSGRIPSH